MFPQPSILHSFIHSFIPDVYDIRCDSVVTITVPSDGLNPTGLFDLRINSDRQSVGRFGLIDGDQPIQAPRLQYTPKRGRSSTSWFRTGSPTDGSDPFIPLCYRNSMSFKYHVIFCICNCSCVFGLFLSLMNCVLMAFCPLLTADLFL
jgi:hypothetical protein